MTAELDLFRRQLWIIFDEVEERLNADCSEVLLDFAATLCATRKIPIDDVKEIIASQYPDCA